MLFPYGIVGTLRARWFAWRAAHPAQTTPPADPPPATISPAPAAGDKR